MNTFARYVLIATIAVAAIVVFAPPANVSTLSVEAQIEALQTMIVDLERDNALLQAHLNDFAVQANRNSKAVEAVAARQARHAARLDEQGAKLDEQADRLERSAEVTGTDRGAPAPRSLELRIEAIEDLLVHVRREGDDLFIEGANLHVRNGAGATDTINGVGNLILGYNEEREFGNDRSGSHTLVLGTRNNFYGFSGIVAGRDNEVGGNWASVLGGSSNSAMFTDAIVLGGNGNRADGPFATVTGGVANEAYGEGAIVSGGAFNVANGRYSVVGGGMRNVAEGDVSLVSRGCDTTVATCGGD